MKIGIVDSGVGGLVVMQGIIKELPKYDYVYVGDTKNSPYGTKTHEDLYKLALPLVDKLFKEKNCKLIILACNSLSAQVLRKLQQDYLPKNYPDRKILGVLIPLAEYVSENYKTVGILATKATVDSNAYVREIHKIDNSIEIKQESASDLVDLIEAGQNNSKELKSAILKHCEKLQNVQAIIPGCTHFPIIASQIKKACNIEVPDAPKIIANSLKKYLAIHQDLDSQLSTQKNREYYLTNNKEEYKIISENIIKERIDFEKW